jgi:hypothetical protein
MRAVDKRLRRLERLQTERELPASVRTPRGSAQLAEKEADSHGDVAVHLSLPGRGRH